MPAEDRQRQPFNLPKLARVNQSLRKGHTGGQDLKAQGFKLAGVGGCDGARNNPAELQTINLTLRFNSISIVTSAFGPYAGAKENRANQQRQGHCSLCALHFRQCAPLRRATCRINDCGCNPFANLMKPFKSRKLLRHLEGRPSGGPSVPIEPQQLVRVQKGICGSKGERGAGAGQDLINTTRA